MIVKWLYAIVSRVSPEVLGQGAVEEAKKLSTTEKLIDVPHKVMSEEAARHGAELAGLVSVGWPLVKREKVKRRVRRKVWEIVSRNFQTSDPDMVEEITERIVDAAEVDPLYERLFDTKKAEREEYL